MDVLTSIFYAGVCGALAAFTPEGNSRIARGLIGIAVGIAASVGWPLLHGLFLR